MSFISAGDVAKCGQLAYRLYTYGWSKVNNAAAQYNEFGQDVFQLHDNLGQLEKVFRTVAARGTRGTIPADSGFYDTKSLMTILDEPLKTIKECQDLLRRRDAFAEERGAIRNIYWNILLEAEVTQLHNRVKFHNVKILALLKPLEIKLLLDIKSLVQDYGDQLLSRIAMLEARLFGETAPALGTTVQCEQILIPQFIVDKFEQSELVSGGNFPMNDGINAFLIHYKEDAVTSTFSGGSLLPPTQSPAQYLRMMKTTWIIQRVLQSPDYIEACQSGNRLLKCFVDGLAQKSLEEFTRFAETPPGNPYKVRNEPDEETLGRLDKDAFSIWPKGMRQPDRFDEANMDSLKHVMRAPLQPPSIQYLAPISSRQKELLLLRHDSTLLEMIIRESSQTDQSTNSQSKNIDLKIVSLNPIYADPNNESSSIDLCVNTMGSRGPDDLLSFRAYNDLYQFQEAITGYRPIIDLVGADLVIHQDSRSSQWRARIQLWNSQRDQTGPNPNQGAPSQGGLSQGRQSRGASTISSRRRSLSVSGESSANSQASKYSSTMSFQTRTTQVTAVTSLMESESDRRSGLSIDASTFEPPKQPLLVLFLRPRRDVLPSKQHLSLIRIPMSEKLVNLDTNNCKCRSEDKHTCRHSELTGLKKALVSNKPLMVQKYTDPTALNLALLGAHHAKGGKQPEQKLNFAQLTFRTVKDKNVFDERFRKFQYLYTRKMDHYEREKRSIRFKTLPGSRT